jgi:hypothetical protein
MAAQDGPGRRKAGRTHGEIRVDKTWEVDEANTVKARFGTFGKKVVTANGKEVYSARRLGKGGEIPFSLPDGRGAAISVKRPFIGTPAIDLRVAGNLVVETGAKPIKCASCGTVAKPYDRFCASCGKAMPTAQDYLNQKHVKSATNAILFLAVLFVIAGIALFLFTKGAAAPLLAKLQGLDPGSMYPNAIEGRTYTVEALRKQLLWEPWGVLIVHLILASIMLGLSIWARRSPLPAVLIATATYAVVIVAAAINDPVTLGQGLLMKIVIIAFLVKGIKAALALRTASA